MLKKIILSTIFLSSIFLIYPSPSHALNDVFVNANCPQKETTDSKFTSRPIECQTCSNDVPLPVNSSSGNFKYSYQTNYNSSETYTCDGGSCDYNLNSCSIDFPDPQSPYDPNDPTVPNPNLNLETSQLLVGPKEWSGSFKLNAQTVIEPFVGNDTEESREKYIADYIDGTIFYKSLINPPSNPPPPSQDLLPIYSQSSINYYTIPPQDPRFFMYSGIYYKLAPQTYKDAQRYKFFHRVIDDKYRNNFSPIHNITISSWLGDLATVVEFFTPDQDPKRTRPLPPTEEKGYPTWEEYFQALASWKNYEDGKWERLWTTLPVASREDTPGEFQPIVQSPAYLNLIISPTPPPLRLPHLARLYESESQLSDLLRPANPQTNTTSSIPSSSNQNQLASLQSFSPSNHFLAQTTTAPTPTATPTTNPTPTPAIYDPYNLNCDPWHIETKATNTRREGDRFICDYYSKGTPDLDCLLRIKKYCGWERSTTDAQGASGYCPDFELAINLPETFDNLGDGELCNTYGGCQFYGAGARYSNGNYKENNPAFLPDMILSYGESMSVQPYVGNTNHESGLNRMWNWLFDIPQPQQALTCTAPPNENGWQDETDIELKYGCKCTEIGEPPENQTPIACGPTQLSTVPQSFGDLRTGPGDKLCGQQTYEIGYDQETFWNANAWQTKTTVPDPIDPPGGTNEPKTNWSGDCSAEYESSFCGAEITCSECSCAYPNKEICTEGYGLLDQWRCSFDTVIYNTLEACQNSTSCSPDGGAGTCEQEWGCIGNLTCCGPDARDGLGQCLDQDNNPAPPLNPSGCCPDSAPNCADSADINDTRCTISPYGTDQDGNRIIIGYDTENTDPPTQLSYTTQREINIATRLPYLGEIWKDLVDDKRSLYKLLTPYRGELTPADNTPWYDFHDGEAIGWLTVSNLGNQYTGISSTRLPFFFPHLGGIQDATVFVRDCLTSAAVYDPVTDTTTNGCSSTINEQSRDCIAKFQKISIMVNTDTGEVLPFIQSMANAGTPVPAITLMDNAISIAGAIKTASPTTIIIGRYFNPEFEDIHLETNPESRAQQWIDNTDLSNPNIDYWQAINEPIVNTEEKMVWLANFEAARVNKLASQNKKACIGNFSTGNPNPDYWDEFEPAFNAINNDNGIVCLHEYAMDENMTIDGNHLGRFQSMYNQIGSRNIKTVISETGIDLAGGATTDGWRTRTTLDNYLTGLTNYDQFLSKFPRIIGATTYILGHPGWPSFELTGDFMTSITNGAQQLTSPGIECTGAGSGTAPPSNLPPGTTVDLKGLGVFTNLQAGSIDQICNNTGTKPKVITLLDNFGIASNIKSQCGTNTIIVGRKYFPNEPNSDANQAATDAFNDISPYFNEPIDYWQGYNEILKTHNMSWVNTYELAFMNKLESQNKKACIGNFKERSGEDFNNMLNALSALNPAIQRANNNGHALCLHEHDSSTSPNTTTWTIAGNYRKIYNALNPSPSRIIITVAGYDSKAGQSGVDSGEGWNGRISATTYLQWLQNYANMLNSNNYVIGASIFSYGMPNWGTYDILPLLK